MDGRREDEPEGQARTAGARIAGTADVLRDPGEGRARGYREEVHRLRGKSRGAGGRHREAVQLVPGNRSAVRAVEDAAEGVEQALHRYHAAGSREQGAAVPAVAVLHRYRRRLRARRVEVVERDRR